MKNKFKRGKLNKKYWTIRTKMVGYKVHQLFMSGDPDGCDCRDCRYAKGQRFREYITGEMVEKILQDQFLNGTLTDCDKCHNTQKWCLIHKQSSDLCPTDYRLSLLCVYYWMPCDRPIHKEV